MNLTLAEQETIITFDEESKTANVYTCRKALQRRLMQLAIDRPDECKVVKTSREGLAIDFEVPKKWIKVSPPRTVNLTEEQRAKLAERLSYARSNAQNAVLPVETASELGAEEISDAE